MVEEYWPLVSQDRHLATAQFIFDSVPDTRSGLLKVDTITYSGFDQSSPAGQSKAPVR